MTDLLILVNGLPGSGKTTLATRLAAAMPATVISKDVIKEALATALPDLPPAAEFWPSWSVEAEPPGVAYGIVVETDGPVDLAGLIQRLRARV